MADKKTKYRLVSEHAEEVALGDKRVMTGPGEFVQLTDADIEANTFLFDDNKLITVETGDKNG